MCYTEWERKIRHKEFTDQSWLTVPVCSPARTRYYHWLNVNPAIQFSRKRSYRSWTFSSLTDQQLSCYWLAMMTKPQTRILGESCLKRDMFKGRRKGGCTKNDLAICEACLRTLWATPSEWIKTRCPRTRSHSLLPIPEEGWHHRTAANIRLGEARDWQFFHLSHSFYSLSLSSQLA